MRSRQSKACLASFKLYCSPLMKALIDKNNNNNNNNKASFELSIFYVYAVGNQLA